MMSVVLHLALMPFSATLAGFVMWLLHRREALDDGALVRNFSVLLVLVAGTAMGVLRTDSVRMRIDPVFRIHTEIEADLLYSTMAQISSGDAETLRATLEKQMAAGDTLSDAYLSAQPFLWSEAKRRTGWVDQATRLEWARFITDALRSAQSNRDYELCFRVMIDGTFDRPTLVEKFSSEHHKRFYDLAIRIYESSNLGMSNERAPEPSVEFNEAAREYSVISEEMEQRFGRETVQLLRRDRLGSAPSSTWQGLCAARIYQLEAMQKRPKPMASRLVDGVVR